MRITSKDQACGTVSSSKVDKIDFFHDRDLPRGGRRRRKHGLHCHRNLYPFHKRSYIRMCIHLYLSLSLYLHLSPCVCTRYPKWNIASQRLFCGSPKAFSCPFLFFWRSIVLARQGFFNGGSAFCFSPRSSKALLVWSGLIRYDNAWRLAWHGIA